MFSDNYALSGTAFLFAKSSVLVISENSRVTFKIIMLRITEVHSTSLQKKSIAEVSLFKI